MHVTMHMVYVCLFLFFLSDKMLHSVRLSISLSNDMDVCDSI